MSNTDPVSAGAYKLEITAVPALPPGTPCGDLLAIDPDGDASRIAPGRLGETTLEEMDRQIQELVDANPGHVFTLTLYTLTGAIYHTQIIEPTRVSADAHPGMTDDELTAWQHNRQIGDQVWWAADNDTGCGPGVIAERYTEDDGGLRYRICAYAWPSDDEPGGLVDDIHVDAIDIRPLAEADKLSDEEQAKLDEITDTLRNREHATRQLSQYLCQHPETPGLFLLRAGNVELTLIQEEMRELRDALNRAHATGTTAGIRMVHVHIVRLDLMFCEVPGMSDHIGIRVLDRYNEFARVAIPHGDLPLVVSHIDYLTTTYGRQD